MDIACVGDGRRGGDAVGADGVGVVGGGTGDDLSQVGGAGAGGIGRDAVGAHSLAVDSREGGCRVETHGALVGDGGGAGRS